MKHGVLTKAKIARIKNPGYVCDGGGLYLQTTVNTRGEPAHSWVFRYPFGKRLNGLPRYREMGLGSYPRVKIPTARNLAEAAHELWQQGLDPIEVRRAKRDATRTDELRSICFKDAAEEYIKLHTPTWTNPKHAKQWPSTLKAYAYPRLGMRPVSAIDGATITEALSSIWVEKQETAKRVKRRIEKVLDWVAKGRPMPQARLNGVEHLPALPYPEIPAFMAELRKVDSIPARALEITLLTGLRTVECIAAEWTEIDFTAKTLTVPAGRMKKRKEHIVPLSKRAIEILEGMPRLSKHIFPGSAKGGRIGDNAMRALFQSMRPEYTVHGTARSCLKDWAGDCTNCSDEVIRFALAHGIPNKTDAAYRRYTALGKRRHLMEDWARYCAGDIGVIEATPIRKKA